MSEMTPSIPLPDVLHVRDTCLCFATQRAARILARRFDAAFRPLGITNNQFSLMMPLNAPTPTSLGRLCAFLGMDQTTMSSALKGLEKAGLITVRPDEEDRRLKRPALTDKGRAILAAALPIWRAEHAALERELPEGVPASLRAALTAVAARTLTPPAGP